MSVSIVTASENNERRGGMSLVIEIKEASITARSTASLRSAGFIFLALNLSKTTTLSSCRIFQASCP